MFDKNKPFWERGNLPSPYVGMVQLGDTCVFASVAAAMNHCARRHIWSWESLYMAHEAQGKGSPTFPTVLEVATGVSEIKPLLRYENTSLAFVWHIDENRQQEISRYIEIVRNCVTQGGVAVVSVQTANEKMERIPGWHMLTLASKQDEWYQVWDTNNLSGVVAEDELATGIQYAGNIPWLVVHDRHDAVLFWPKK